MSDSRQWIGFSDLMSVMMMVFLFIAVAFMLKVQQEQQQLAQEHATMRSIAQTHASTKTALASALAAGLRDQLPHWDAQLLPGGGVRFSRPQALFTIGESALSDSFRRDLNQFFPAYIELLASAEWKDKIQEIRIEGHTSSDWGGGDSPYLQNAALSQARAFAVLAYVYQLPQVAAHRPWLKKVLRATGASSAVPTLNNGIEDQTRSRRVEFHAQVRSDEALNRILASLQEGDD